MHSKALVLDKCSNKLITMGRIIDFNFLENEGFDFGSKLIKMSWEFLCFLNVPTYPRLVKEFYNTLREVENGCQCMVQGKHLYIIANVMAKISQASAQEYAEINFSDKGTILRLIYEKDEINPEAEISASQLPTKMRLFHSVICHILFPRTNRFDYLIERDLILIYYILKEIPNNLS